MYNMRPSSPKIRSATDCCRLPRHEKFIDHQRPTQRLEGRQNTMNSIQTGIRTLASIGIFAALMANALAGSAAAQNILATIPIPSASAGQIAVNPALNRIYSGGGPTTGSSLTVIDSKAFIVVPT